MAKKEQIDYVFNFIMKAQPQKFYKLITDSNAGIGAVLRMLDQAVDSVTAGKLSEDIGVSEARITALIKKMEKRGYIVKEKDSSDARITIIKLSEKGKKTADTIRKNLRSNIEIVIDSIGMGKIEQYIKLTTEINGIIKTQTMIPPDLD